MQKEVLLVIFCTFFLLGCPASEISSPEESSQEAILPSPPLSENVQQTESVTVKEGEELLKKDTALVPEQKALTSEEKIWKKRIDIAMAPTFCPSIEKKVYPENYYQGPLIDTHVHIPAIPDSLPEKGEGTYKPEENEEGAFGGPQAVLGWNVKMSEIACTLRNEGTRNNFAFFPVYPEIYLQALEIANKTMAEYPNLFTAFIMPPTEDTPTVEASMLRRMLTVYPKLFKGYGEVGSSPTEEKNPPPDDPLYLENYKLAREYHLVVYYHLGYGHRANFERVLVANSDLYFIWHGDALSIDEIKEVLSKHPNAYYGVETMGEGSNFGIFPLFVGKSKDAYLDAMERHFDDLLSYDLKKRKSLIEQYPDQVIWGTDRGDAEWNYDVEVGQIMVEYARAFIGKLKPEVQEKFAYKNAEKLLKS